MYFKLTIGITFKNTKISKECLTRKRINKSLPRIKFSLAELKPSLDCKIFSSSNGGSSLEVSSFLVFVNDGVGSLTKLAQLTTCFEPLLVSTFFSEIVFLFASTNSCTISTVFELIISELIPSDSITCKKNINTIITVIT